MGSSEIIQLAPPQLGEDEKNAVVAVIESGWITQGERVADFENKFAALHGAERAVAISSCTAGLHMALMALDIGPGDEVLVPSLTFVATTNAILYVGATPVFVDIENLERPHISLEDAAAKCSDKTKAIIVVHYGGYPVDMPRWRQFADDRGLKLVEDAAHSPGIPEVGKFSEISTFSFFGNKNMTTAEGGMLISRDDAITDKLLLLRSHGMTSSTLDRDRGHAYSYDVVLLGYNYRMDEIRAALGLVQLAKLSDWHEKRLAATRKYRELLGKRLPQVIIPFKNTDSAACHLMAILLPDAVDRSEVMGRLRSRGVQSSIHYPGVHGFSLYRERFGRLDLEMTDRYTSRELTLPLHAALRTDQIDRVVSVLEESMNNA